MFDFLKLIRFPNLLIVAFTQYLIQYGVLIPNFAQANLSPALPHWQFFLFVLSTLLIAATGYIINDIVDAPIDQINKPERLIISKKISVKNGWRLYGVLTLVGFIISLYLAIFIKNIPLVFIYPAAVLLLAAYSFYLKKMPLAGNVVVAIFCAFVPGVVLFAERLTHFQLQLIDNQSAMQILSIVGGYTAFAFISTLFREIIKDLEDVEGDQVYGCRTLPIVIGVNKTKVIVALTGIIFIVFLIKMAAVLYAKQLWIPFGFSVIFLLIPLLVLLFLLKNSSTPVSFHRLSTGAKVLMLNGLILLIFWSLQ